MDDFNVTHETRPPVEVVAVSGELDAYSCSSLESEIDVAVARSDLPVVIDLTNVAFLDSTAIALLLRTRERLQASRRRLVVVGQTPPVGRLFALTAVDQMLELFPSLDAAIRATRPDPDLALDDGTAIPQVGFGVYQIDPEQTTASVAHALGAGYRHVDTARAYGNEAEVGAAVRATPGDVYVTTKYFNPEQDHGYDDAKAHFDASFAALGLDHVDLYLIHWPVWRNERYVESWKALVDMRGGTRLRSIGVSNFAPDHLRRVIEATGVTPAVNQVELHPYYQQRELRVLHDELGIATEAWGPLGQGSVLEDPTLREIGAAHSRTVSQVVLRWHLQLGTILIPKSVTPSRIDENLALFDFELTSTEMAAIDGLDRGARNGPDPSVDEFPRPRD